MSIEKARKTLRWEDIVNIVNRIEYLDWSFHVGKIIEGIDGPWYIQVMFDAWDLKTGTCHVQHGRKWFISRHSTTSEVVQTALMAVLAAQEHEVREEFRYRGKAIFGPHFDVEELAMRMPAMDLREPLAVQLHPAVDRKRSLSFWGKFLTIGRKAVG